MGYQGFWGLCALSLVLLGHGVYCWVTATKGKELQPLSNIKKIQLGALAGVCLLAFVSGVVMMFCHVEDAAIHAMGLALLLSAFGWNNKVRRYLPEMIKKEE